MARWSDSSSSVSIRRVHACRVFGLRSRNASGAKREREREGARCLLCVPCLLTSFGAIAVAVAIAVVAVTVARATAADVAVSAVYSARQPHANIYERIQKETE